MQYQKTKITFNHQLFITNNFCKIKIKNWRSPKKKLSWSFFWVNQFFFFYETKVVGNEKLMVKSTFSFLICYSVLGCCTVKSKNIDVQKSFQILTKLKT